MSRPAFDYVVVGGGTAGCVVASRLSEDPAATVCLIEAGGWPRHPAMSAPMLNFITSAMEQHQWGYVAEPDKGLGGRAPSYAQARVVGGGSSINGMLYARGDHNDYAAWDCPDWSYEQVLPWFERAEEQIGISHGGPLTPVCEMFLAAAGSAGYPRLETMNGQSADGFGYFDLNIARGRRRGTATAYLRAAARRPNLTVIAGADVMRVVLEKNRAAGVTILRNGVATRVGAEREVIVCAGGINSPKLLMLSGIGPADHLRTMGVEALVDLPGVGKNLQNHVRQKLAYTTREPVTAYGLLSAPSLLKAAGQYLMGGGGILGRSVLTAGGLLRSSPDRPIPDIGVIFTPGLMGAGRGISGRLPRAHGFSVFVRQARPWSRGEVRLRSADPLDAPVIDTRYFSDPGDMPVLIAGVRRVKEILEQPEIAAIIDRADDSDLSPAAVARAAAHAFHPVGTCRIGGGEEAVVDESLRVRGVEGLRIADASVIPVIPKSGTNAPAVMIGERAAALIHAET